MTWVVVSNLVAFGLGMFVMRTLTRLGFLATDKIPDHTDGESSMNADSRRRLINPRGATIALFALVLFLLAFGLGLSIGYEVCQ